MRGSAQEQSSPACIPILIPAYQPGHALVELVRSLLSQPEAVAILVDDGSGPQFEEYFQKAGLSERVHLVRHAVNLGKGAALKTGMNYALVQFPDCAGVVTADADGQHHPEDILRIVQRLRAQPAALIMGVREFQSSVPLRSRVGNVITRFLMRLLVGQRLSDSQTGLRGIPRKLISYLLRVPSSGYEFELDMLIACKHQGCAVLEEPIRTIYLDGNRSSHFNPLWDSMRIYLVLFRFSILSMLTAALDNLVFILIFSKTGSIAGAQVAGRFLAMIFNYTAARRVVFHSAQKHVAVFPKYVLLVACNGFVSYVLIQFLYRRWEVQAVSAKLLAEGALFIANFAIQRDFVFTQKRDRRTATDWDSYYKSVPPTAKLTRKYTTKILLATMRMFASPSKQDRLSVIEIGGANSCFVDSVIASVNLDTYDVVDTNRYGLSLLEERLAGNSVVRLHQQSVFDLALDRQADLVFSVGLVEHFDSAGTRDAVLAHFDAVRPGGVVIVTFPTPTPLYRCARKVIELLGMWKFPDERPLRREEVLSTISERGDLLFEKTLWPLILTQHLIAARKRPATPNLPA